MGVANGVDPLPKEAPSDIFHVDWNLKTGQTILGLKINSIVFVSSFVARCSIFKLITYGRQRKIKAEELDKRTPQELEVPTHQEHGIPPPPQENLTPSSRLPNGCIVSSLTNYIP